MKAAQLSHYPVFMLPLFSEDSEKPLLCPSMVFVYVTSDQFCKMRENTSDEKEASKKYKYSKSIVISSV